LGSRNHRPGFSFFSFSFIFFVTASVILMTKCKAFYYTKSGRPRHIKFRAIPTQWYDTFLISTHNSINRVTSKVTIFMKIIRCLVL
jgi:hypothetical protein